jgi:nucleoside-diphosphate-sugar epimerase
MNILIVGGTGLLGGHAALYLHSLGHQVTIAARRPAPAATPMAQLPFVSIDFVAGNARKEDLQGFDAMVLPQAMTSAMCHPRPMLPPTGCTPMARPCPASLRWPAKQASAKPC